VPNGSKLFPNLLSSYFLCGCDFDLLLSLSHYMNFSTVSKDLLATCML
jgi:hypothetical protein